jgi:acyl-CoA synthetase (NDP forming)
MPADLEAIRHLLSGLGERTALTEPEAQEITRAMGIGTPAMWVAGDADEASRARLAGGRVMVKAVGPPHKTDFDGVTVVDNDPAAIASAVRAIEASAPPGLEGFLVAEFIAHDQSAEILAGVRWTEAFGPVVSIGPGGIGVEAGKGSRPAIIAPATAHRIEATLSASAGTAALTTPHRGGATAATQESLADLASRLLALGLSAMPHHLTEYEINPLVFTADGPVALDAVALAADRDPDPEAPPRPPSQIASQLRPRSIAVMGVSERMNPGRVILRNVLAAGFPPDRVTVIKPGVTEIDGCHCVPDLSSVDADLMVVAVAAEAVPGVVDEALASGTIRSMILIPGGLGERLGTEDAAARIRATIAGARSSGRPAPVLTGPNSMGIRSVPGAYDTTFIPRERMTPATARRHAPMAVIAQSGAFTLSRLDRLPWLEPRYVVTVGNQIDLTVGDYLAYFADDHEVSVAACYLEGFRFGDGDRALRAAERLRERGGLTLWYRGGRTPAGARSAATHTAAVATDDVVARSLAAQAGILEAATLDQFDDLVRLAVLLHDKSIQGSRIAVVSNAGFECVAASDALGDLTPAVFSPDTKERLGAILQRAGLDAITAGTNPLDLTPMANDDVFVAAVEAALDDPGVDLAAIGCVPFTPALQALPDDVAAPGSLPTRLAALATHPKPWVAVIDAGRLYDPMADRLEEAGVPVLRSMDRALRLLGRYAAARSGA